MVILLSSHVAGVHSPGRALLLRSLGSWHHVGITVGWDGRWDITSIGEVWVCIVIDRRRGGISINLHSIDLINATTGASCWSRVPLLSNALVSID